MEGCSTTRQALPMHNLALAFGINQIAHDIRVHLDDEDLSAEEARVLAILAIAEKSPLPARVLLDAAYFDLERGSKLYHKNITMTPEEKYEFLVS